MEKESPSEKPILDEICLDDLFADGLIAPLTSSLLWKRATEEHGHGGCCCCCCCDHEKRSEPAVGTSVAWARGVLVRSLATRGRTIIVQGWLSWTAQAPPDHTVSIWARIRDANGSTVLNWAEVIAGQDLIDNLWVEIGRVHSFFSRRRYRWDFQARLVDASGNTVRRSALCPLDAFVDPTPSVPRP